MSRGGSFRRLGLGFGRFWGNPPYPEAPFGYPTAGGDEASWLAGQAKDLERQLEQIRARLTELEKGDQE
jgi:hypothetical protein